MKFGMNPKYTIHDTLCNSITGEMNNTMGEGSQISKSNSLFFDSQYVKSQFIVTAT